MAEVVTTDERLETAPEICDLYDAEPSVRAIAQDGIAPAQCIEQLTADKYLIEATGFMGRWLTKREAVWWGALCLWQSRRPQMQPSSESLLQAIVQWVLDPTEERRQQVRSLSKVVKRSEPVSTLAMALFATDGSISLPDQPEVLPPPDLTAQLVASMLRVVATRVPNYRKDEAYQQFLRLGLEVIAGTSHWEEDPS